MAEDTLPKLLARNYQRYGDKKIAMRKKTLGVWKRYTWKDYYENVKYFSLGLVSLGLQRGDKLCILGENNPQWFWAEVAAHSAGGVSIGIYTDVAPPELKYIVDHSDASFIVAEDQEQVDKIIQVKNELPRLKRVIYWDRSGLGGYDEPYLMSFQQVQELGRKYEAEHPDFFANSVNQGKGDDLAILSYTSGTSGLPKGVMLLHRNLITSMTIWAAVYPLHEDDEYVSYMSPAWITEQFFGITGGLMFALRANFLEEPETVQENIREIGPRILMYGSKLWESVISTIQARLADSTPFNRFFYGLALPVGYKYSSYCYEKKKPPLFWRVANRVADGLVFRPLRDKVGLLKTKHAITAGSTLSPDAFQYLRAVGVNLKQIFGITEVGNVSMHRDNDIRFESVGQICPQVEVKFTEAGELLVKSGGVAVGYYKSPEASQKAFRDGWFHSGDAGYMDKDGHFIYWDRVVDLLELAGGTKFSPQYIEGRLKFSPYVKDVMVLGGKDKAYVTAIVNIDFENVGKWAEKRRIAYTTFVDLSQRPPVVDLIRQDIERVNKTLPDTAKVRKFVLLHKEFDPDEAELTRTRKLRRGNIEKRYQDLINAMYKQDGSEFTVEAPVVYRDGRTGVIKTQLKINALDHGEVK
ncbi:MAG: AMP-binding protein [Chloroflexi bacterium]|nr:AMP-binding protein [Chloroflexota bacterium]